MVTTKDNMSGCRSQLPEDCGTTCTYLCNAWHQVRACDSITEEEECLNSWGPEIALPGRSSEHFLYPRTQKPYKPESGTGAVRGIQGFRAGGLIAGF